MVKKKQEPLTKNEKVTKFKRKHHKCPMCGRATCLHDDDMGTYYTNCVCGFKAEFDYNFGETKPIYKRD